MGEHNDSTCVSYPQYVYDMDIDQEGQGYSSAMIKPLQIVIDARSLTNSNTPYGFAVSADSLGHVVGTMPQRRSYRIFS